MNKYLLQQRNLLFCYFFLFLSFPAFTQSQDSLQIQARVDPNAKPFYKKLIAPASLITAGLLVFPDNSVLDRHDIYDFRQKNFSDFRTHVDDYLQFAPIAAVYALDAFGVKAKHNFRSRTIRILAAEIISQGIILPIKKFSEVERPDHSNFLSFPSGHTTQAFVAATFMHLEYGHLSPWYSIGAYTTAATVGAMRILNNKHWLSDVLVGAGVGILSTHLAYLVLPNKLFQEDKKASLLILPNYSGQSAGLAMVLLF